LGKLQPRADERVTHLRETAFQVVPGGISGRGHTIDLSSRGVRIFTTRSLAVGDEIDLTWDDRTPPISVPGRVVHIKVDLDGDSAGIVFHRPLSPAVFHRLRSRRV
jgi:hypothetical protein